jgi:hypothetical protein
MTAVIVSLSTTEHSNAIGYAVDGTPAYTPAPMRKFEDAIKYDQEMRPVFKCRKCEKWKYFFSFHHYDLAIRRKGICHRCTNRTTKNVFRPRFKIVDNTGTLRFFCKLHGRYLPASAFPASYRNTRRALCYQHAALEADNARKNGSAYKTRRSMEQRTGRSTYCMRCALPSSTRICAGCKHNLPAVSLGGLLRSKAADQRPPRSALFAVDEDEDPLLSGGNITDNASAWLAMPATAVAKRKSTRDKAMPNRPQLFEDVDWSAS